LPPGIDDRAAVLADMIVIPQPRLGIDRFSNRTKDAQGAPTRAPDPFLALTHQGAQGGWCGVEDPNIVLVDDLPEAGWVRVVRDPREEEGCGAVGERAIDDVAVSGYPADIGGAPVDLAVTVIEDVLMGHRGVDEIPAGGVKDAFGLSGRA